MRNYSIVGKSLPLIDAIPKVTGQAKFCADMELPGMLCGKVLRSPHPPCVHPEYRCQPGVKAFGGEGRGNGKGHSRGKIWLWASLFDAEARTLKNLLLQS